LPKIYEPAPPGKSTLVISGTLTAGVAGTVVYAGLIGGVPCWSTNGTQTPGAANVIVEYTGTAWKISLSSSYTALKTSVSTSGPEGLTTWTVTPGTGSPTVAAAGVVAPPVVFVP
jgi:hypothetical protein